MNKKTIIEIVITVVAFSASAYVLYHGLHPAVSYTSAPVNVTASQATNILPYGTSLDFSVLEKQHFEYGRIDYPVLSPSEVGVDPTNLIQPLPITH